CLCFLSTPPPPSDTPSFPTRRSSDLEAVELPGRAIRRGDKVRKLAPRGENKAKDDRLWRVQRVERVDGKRLAHLSALEAEDPETDRKSTRLNSSHVSISYAVFCLKKK